MLYGSEVLALHRTASPALCCLGLFIAGGGAVLLCLPRYLLLQWMYEEWNLTISPLRVLLTIATHNLSKESPSAISHPRTFSNNNQCVRYSVSDRINCGQCGAFIKFKWFRCCGDEGCDYITGDYDTGDCDTGDRDM